MMKSFPIILILMAILVPSMLGYVKKSKEAEARASAYETYESYGDIGWDD